MNRAALTPTQRVLLGSHSETTVCSESEGRRKQKTVMRYITQSGSWSQGLGKSIGDKATATWGNQLCPRPVARFRASHACCCWVRRAQAWDVRLPTTRHFHILDPMPKQAEMSAWAPKDSLPWNLPESTVHIQTHSTKLFTESTLFSFLRLNLR